MKRRSKKDKKQIIMPITSEEIKKNIGFLGTKGKLLRALLLEKKIEKLR